MRFSPHFKTWNLPQGRQPASRGASSEPSQPPCPPRRPVPRITAIPPPGTVRRGALGSQNLSAGCPGSSWGRGRGQPCCSITTLPREMACGTSGPLAHHTHAAHICMCAQLHTDTHRHHTQMHTDTHKHTHIHTYPTHTHKYIDTRSHAHPTRAHPFLHAMHNHM